MTAGRSRAVERTLFGGLFASIADEMLAALVRSAYSPNIKERRDCSTALFGPDGVLIAQAAAIPVHLGAMPLSVAAARAVIETWVPGDVVILNDPYQGGTHLPDITLVSPVFNGADGPIAFLASRAHHADVGGVTPGSMPVARSIEDEGVRFGPVYLLKGGEPVAATWERLLSGVRTPREREGDLRAQMASHRIGERRVLALVERHGHGKIGRRVADLIAYGAKQMSAAIGTIPDGRYAFEDQLDGDGVGTGAIPIRVAIEIDGDRAVVDFDGSAPPCLGSVNTVRAVTESAVRYCFVCILVTGSGDRSDEIVINGGSFDPIEILTPRPSIVDATYPSAVAAGNVETSQRIVDVVLGALAEAVPEVVPAASQGTMNNLTLGGVSPLTGEPFAVYETIGGGAGAGPWGSGVSGRHSHMTNTWNTPAEALEFAYPLRVERYAIRRGSGGRGTHRGGDGVCREIRLLGSATGSLLADRRESAPYGLSGAEQGTSGRDTVVRADEVIDLKPKMNLYLHPGDLLRIETPGGGGWGKP